MKLIIICVNRRIRLLSLKQLRDKTNSPKLIHELSRCLFFLLELKCQLGTHSQLSVSQFPAWSVLASDKSRYFAQPRSIIVNQYYSYHLRLFFIFIINSGCRGEQKRRENQRTHPIIYDEFRTSSTDSARNGTAIPLVRVRSNKQLI